MPANRSSPTVGRRMSKLTKIGYLSCLWLREFISIAKSKNFVCTGTGCQSDDSLSLKVTEDNLNGGSQSASEECITRRPSQDKLQAIEANL
jgi:hypothetical protein